MKMKRTLLLFLLFMIIIISSCGILSPDQSSAFSIYLLNDKSITIYNNPGNRTLNKQLEATPILSAEDIEYYDWSTHCIYLKSDKATIRARFMDSTASILTIGAFVVASKGQPEYYGFFHSLLLSIAASTPNISAFSFDFNPPDIISIDASWNNDEPDTRNNDKVKQALIDAGLFHAGIEIEFDSDYGLHIDSLTDQTMQVEYRYTITNNDQDALYVLDPLKASDSVFFYFNLRPSFHHVSTEQTYRATNPYEYTFGYPPNTDFSQLDWYTLLAPGKSKTFTACAGVYDIIEAGDLEFTLGYNTPSLTLTREIRTKPLGRIWIGEINSPTYTVNYTP